MLRGTTDAPKRADFIVNLTNDGWFWEQEHWQHLQAIVFRAIENRVPIARASNTGVSGFIDSLGRVKAALLPGTEGALSQTLVLDRRSTFYTRFGDLFAGFCTLATVAVVAFFTTKRLRRR
jgi:apolipoprotein N-acyltransferase